MDMNERLIRQEWMLYIGFGIFILLALAFINLFQAFALLVLFVAGIVAIATFALKVADLVGDYQYYPKRATFRRYQVLKLSLIFAIVSQLILLASFEQNLMILNVIYGSYCLVFIIELYILINSCSPTLNKLRYEAKTANVKTEDFKKVNFK